MTDDAAVEALKVGAIPDLRVLAANGDTIFQSTGLTGEDALLPKMKEALAAVQK
ncbi:MAG: hypothetical protein HYZ53_29835 [Planctomycetes bacterium]|nr:hypothetical protein [Planctomycetota bacterium]